MLPNDKGIPQVNNAIQQHTDADKSDECLCRLERIEQDDYAKSDHQDSQKQQDAPFLVALFFDINGGLQFYYTIQDEVQPQDKGQDGNKQLRFDKEADAQRQRHDADHQRQGSIALLPMRDEAVYLPQAIGSGYAAQYIAEDIDGGCGPHDESNAQRHIADSGKNEIQYKFFRHSK